MSDTEITLALINQKLDTLTEKVCENQKQIDELREQVNLGRGALTGLKVVFWLGSVVTVMYTITRFFK